MAPVETDGQVGTGVSVRGLCAGYGSRQVLYEVDFDVDEGEIVAVLGHNGAGKTTLLKSIAGLIKADAGTIELLGGAGAPGSGLPAEMAMVPADVCVFGPLSVRDNLRLGGRGNSRRDNAERVEEIVALFPRLGQRLEQKAGSMSGGEKRMLGLGIALMRSPRVLLLDEPSLGLAPATAESLFETIATLARERSLSVVLVEQNINQALAISERAYVLRGGRMIIELEAKELARRENTWELF